MASADDATILSGRKSGSGGSRYPDVLGREDDRLENVVEDDDFDRAPFDRLASSVWF